jgi:hypothetical protein
MPATFTLSGPNLTITFAYTGPTQVITDVANDAAHFLFNNQVDRPATSFDSLNNTQKLAILDEYVKGVLIDISRRYYVQDAVETARVTAQTAANANLSL